MLDRLRGRIASVMARVGRGCARVLPSPTAWTVLGLFFALFASILYAYGGTFGAGLLLLVSGFFDMVDGAVARATGRVSQRGAFLDSTLDRVGEVAVFLGILMGGYTNPYPVLTTLALALSMLVSYTRAKGDALGVSLAGVGVGERSERLIVIIVASLLGLLGLGVLLVLVLALVTFVQRVAKLSGALTQPRPDAAQPSP